MNIREIAKLANVSVATVSRVLNGSDKVKPATRKRIEDILLENHFVRYNAHARRKRMHNLTIVTASYTYDTSQFCEELIHQFMARGYRVMLAFAQKDFKNLHSILENYQSSSDGFILLADSFHEWPVAERSYIMNLAKTLPIFMINERVDAPNIYSLILDTPTRIYHEVNHSIKTGHPHVMFLFHGMSINNLRVVDQYNAAFAMNHMEIESRLIHMCPDQEALTAYLNDERVKELALDEIIVTSPLALLWVEHYLSTIGNKEQVKACYFPYLSQEFSKVVASTVLKRLSMGYAAEYTLVPLTDL